MSARPGPKPRPDTRDNLVREGMRLFHGAGYNATGIKDIVGAARVPKGSFYNHFESKEAFAAEAIDFYFGSGAENMRRQLTDASVLPLDRLRTYFDDRIRAFNDSAFLRGCLLGNMGLEVADHSDVIRQRLVEHFRDWSALIEACVREAQESGAVRTSLPAGVIASFLLNGWEGALVRMRVERSETPLIEFRQVVFDQLLA